MRKKLSDKFSKAWKSSTKAAKQRKYRANAPLHIKHKFMSVHLSKELKEKFNTRSLTPKKGDKIKVVRGSNKGKIGKINTINLKKSKIFVEGVEVVKKDGNKALIPIDPSNVVLIEYDTGDKMRKKIIERKKKNKKEQK
tara:strand:- start:7671 stop:8087 length:417 start_codon:yes stop_codon:yes gene_type:complete